MTTFPALETLSRSSMSCSATKESKPLVGSSQKIIPGLVTSSTPILVLFRCPPERASPIIKSAHPTRPRCIRFSSTMASISSFVTLRASRNRAENLSASRGVEVSCKISNWGTYAILLWNALTPPGREAILQLPYRKSPLMSMFLPDLTLPDKNEKRAVLPAPEGPMMAVVSPGFAPPQTLSRTILVSFLFFTTMLTSVHRSDSVLL
mmetsp:Transcript_8657/g.12622  ORF Transcript_8657/g.12622 Transcript_8657/m.12622 type:complete len:207 (+) Transcript_8657:1304-1924(+)